jgi:hypothetical protein
MNKKTSEFLQPSNLSYCTWNEVTAMMRLGFLGWCFRR